MAHHCTCGGNSYNDSDSAVAPLRPDETVGDIVRRQTGALEILKEMGINHCCGAHLTLREAAAASGVSLDILLAALAG